LYSDEGESQTFFDSEIFEYEVHSQSVAQIIRYASATQQPGAVRTMMREAIGAWRNVSRL
jgi:hypothetical protein